MTFGQAIAVAKEGARVTRDGWNGKGQFIFYSQGIDITVADLTNLTFKKWALGRLGADKPLSLRPHLDLFTAQGDVQVGWLASQTDVLADDWRVLDD